MWATNDFERRWIGIAEGRLGLPVDEAAIYERARAMRAEAVRDTARKLAAAAKRLFAAPKPAAAAIAISPLDHPRYRAELQHAEAVADAIVAVSRAVANLPNALKEWRVRRRTYAELMSLDDRTLADIGITRGEIGQIAAGRYVPALRGAAKLVGRPALVGATNSNRPKLAA